MFFLSNRGLIHVHLHLIGLLYDKIKSRLIGVKDSSAFAICLSES